MKQVRMLVAGALACSLSFFAVNAVGDTRSDVAKEDAVQLVAKVEIPRIRVREYHRPYVAVWIEDEDRTLKQHLAVWYQLGKNEEGHGKKWLPDLRQWWRRGGRELDLPLDGVSGATRAVGTHAIRVSASQLSKLAAGKYSLVVEASREVGGRELVRLPFTWPSAKQQSLNATGKSELGKVTLEIKPSLQR